YPYALKNHLRDSFIYEEMKSHEAFDVALLKDVPHVPNRIAETIYQRFMHLYDAGVIKNEQLIILDNELKQFTDICGACERIKKTPIPFSYSSFLKKFIFFYIMALPVALAFSVGYMS